MTLLRIGFEKGVPVSLNGKELRLSELLRRLNELGGNNGIGIYDLVEDRVVGMKARGIYEIPAVTILLKAQSCLEALVLDRETLETKRTLSEKFARFVRRFRLSLRAHRNSSPARCACVSIRAT